MSLTAKLQQAGKRLDRLEGKVPADQWKGAVDALSGARVIVDQGRKAKGGKVAFRAMRMIEDMEADIVNRKLAKAIYWLNHIAENGHKMDASPVAMAKHALIDIEG